MATQQTAAPAACPTCGKALGASGAPHGHNVQTEVREIRGQTVTITKYAPSARAACPLCGRVHRNLAANETRALCLFNEAANVLNGGAPFTELNAALLRAIAKAIESGQIHTRTAPPRGGARVPTAQQAQPQQAPAPKPQQPKAATPPAPIVPTPTAPKAPKAAKAAKAATTPAIAPVPVPTPVKATRARKTAEPQQLQPEQPKARKPRTQVSLPTPTDRAAELKARLAAMKK